jgi:hypothetical protein
MPQNIHDLYIIGDDGLLELVSEDPKTNRFPLNRNRNGIIDATGTDAIETEQST